MYVPVDTLAFRIRFYAWREGAPEPPWTSVSLSFSSIPSLGVHVLPSHMDPIRDDPKKGDSEIRGLEKHWFGTLIRGEDRASWENLRDFFWGSSPLYPEQNSKNHPALPNVFRFVNLEIQYPPNKNLLVVSRGVGGGFDQCDSFRFPGVWFFPSFVFVPGGPSPTLEVCP